MNTNGNGQSKQSSSSSSFISTPMGVEIDLAAKPSESDPRIKSPDELLTILSSKKPETETNLGKETNDKVKALSLELKQLRESYDNEIAQWRDYESRVQEWRAQVITIVQGLKRELANKESVEEELNQTKHLLKLHEEEIERIREAIQPKSKPN